MLPKLLVIHHTASNRDRTTLEDVNNWHKVRFNFLSSLGYYVGYHYVITGNGKITQTREETELGAHSIPNEGKIGICLTGNFEIEQPNRTQLISLETLLNRLKMRYNLTDKEIKAHSELNSTLCPGKNLKIWLNLYRRRSILEELIEKIKQLINLFKGR